MPKLMMLIEKNIFSLAIAFNLFSMTLYMISLSFVGNSEMAADVGIVQGASLAAFMAFSANARNLILGSDDGSALKQQFYFRLIMVIPLTVAAYFLSSNLVGISGVIVILLIMRRCFEWFAELQISEREKFNDKPFAFRFCLLQSVSLLMLIATVATDSESLFLFILMFWTATPLLQSAPFLLRMIKGQGEVRHLTARSFLPHLGSSWAIAITTYTFRILIVLLVGRSVAGMLFSAYAIGGMLNAVYTYALGPSLALQERVAGGDGSAKLLTRIVAGLLLVGLSLAAVSNFSGLFSSESQLFSMTIGFSLMGGGIMILAHRRRIHMLQVLHVSPFVPDVLSNILLVASVPFVFFLFGVKALSLLFLWSALLAYMFYAYADVLAQRDKIKGYLKNERLSIILSRQPLQAVVLLLFFFPLFFQLSGAIFSSPLMEFDSMAMLTRLPLPLSAVFCFVGVILLIQFDRAHLSTSTIFVVFICMLLTSFTTFSGNNDGYDLTKLVLIVQYTLPLFALVLGQAYVQPENVYLKFEALLLYVIAMIVPAEVCSTLIQGEETLSPYLYLFSIYQHTYYMPEIVTGAYLLALYTLCGENRLRTVIVLLAPFMAVYLLLAHSLLAMIMLVAWLFMAPFVLIKYRRPAMLSAALMAFSMFMFVATQSESAYFFNGNSPAFSVAGIHSELAERLYYWNIYMAGIFESAGSFLFGHNHLPPLLEVRSAYNYYMGLIYSFGVIAWIPLMALLSYTITLIYQQRHSVMWSSGSIALAVVVLFFVCIENSFKVSLRQPYPGMIIFFMWGVLLTRLLETKSNPLITTQRQDS